ncbi:RNA polymerase II subunit A [Carpediemonas membranifera]|uniref:RNA polymerase II subunit A C-terminal domain phosphatase SSU72 n=1 Tax=Carpediemonas membranifera TaxID=201153 RepID=A0A8J6E231_9EUKA|nr:RNA polymerase II subunit A [Carpediemonas membranifera]|eukprot:KAG9393806.1 RNA polymerase II subunit A [Carpediemonas membranifera]
MVQGDSGTMIDDPGPILFRTALVCASNVNRSIEAHRFFLEQGYPAELIGSYGAADAIRLPSPTGFPLTAQFSPSGLARSPGSKTTYQRLIDECMRRGADFYTREGIIAMLERDMTVKDCPESFQQTFRGRHVALPSLVITFDRIVYSELAQFIAMELQRGDVDELLLVNIATVDSIAGASLGAIVAFDIATKLGAYHPNQWPSVADGVLAGVGLAYEQSLTHSLFYV